MAIVFREAKESEREEGEIEKLVEEHRERLESIIERIKRMSSKAPSGIGFVVIPRRKSGLAGD